MEFILGWLKYIIRPNLSHKEAQKAQKSTEPILSFLCVQSPPWLKYHPLKQVVLTRSEVKWRSSRTT